MRGTDKQTETEMKRERKRETERKRKKETETERGRQTETYGAFRLPRPRQNLEVSRHRQV